MKKRLFISSILMTLVLLVAITTATFAWYSATSASATLTPGSTGTITAKSSGYSAGDLTITGEFTGDLASACTLDLTDVNGKTYVRSGSTNLEVSSAQSKTFATGTIVATLSGAANASNEQRANFAGTYTVTVTAGAHVRITDDADAKFAAASIGNSISFTVVIAADGTVTNNGPLTYYVSLEPNNYSGLESDRTDAVTMTITKTA